VSERTLSELRKDCISALALLAIAMLIGAVVQIWL
jgi:hypothetical protein